MKTIDFSELEFEDLLGRGGQGAVHRGLWKKRAVAIKQVIGRIRKEEVSWFNVYRLLEIVKSK